MKLLVFIILLPLCATAMPIKTQLLKPRAYFQEVDGGLLEALDLKAKSLSFGKKDFDQCGAGLVRRAQTLSFSCTLPIASHAKISRLQNLVTAAKIDTAFGASKREVTIEVSSDAKTVTFATGFDQTGIDFEIFKFNDDFYSIYAKAAQLTISEALARQPVRIEVLESR